jgi:serine/threonine protein kinase
MDEPDSSNTERTGLTVWSSMEPGAEISATVLFAAGFALDPDRPVRERYRVERRLGAGSMGQVLSVTLVGEQSQQTFALKLVARPRSSSSRETRSSEPVERDPAEEAATRWLTGLLRSEAAKQEAAQRHGVTVARFVALVRLDDGALGLRMEMARGRSWGALIESEAKHRDDPPDIYRAIRATRKLLGQLRRLHYAREPGAPAGFVHSDIKPTNVFVDDNDPTDPSVTLLDFGVATAGRAAIEGEASMLGRETFVLRQTGGTPGYAPPGHFGARPSPASDVHAAIVCMYEWVALQLPWDIDDIDPSPAGFALLELRISAAPRPVRSHRPSIPESEARALDRFFESAFTVLQARSNAWATALSGRGRDEDSADQRALADELATLAGDYQRALDGLTRELESLGIAHATVSSPLHDSVIELEPEVIRDPTALDTAPTMVASARPPGLGAGDTQSDPPLALPLRARRWPRPVALLSAAALVSVVLLVRALSPSKHALPTGPTPTDSGVIAFVDAATTSAELDAGARAVAEDHGVSLATAPTAALDPQAIPRVFRGGRALALLASQPRRDAGADASSGTSASALCVASARGVRVVAHGGALERDVELCVTDTLSDRSTGEYAGRGAMDTDVLRALPSVQCVGEGRWLTAVRRFSVGAGQTWLFTCTRPAPDPVEPAAPEAASPAADAADEASRATASGDPPSLSDGGPSSPPSEAPTEDASSSPAGAPVARAEDASGAPVTTPERPSTSDSPGDASGPAEPPAREPPPREPPPRVTEDAG